MPKTTHFPCRTATTPAFTPSAEIAFVQLDGSLENLIGSQVQMMADDHTDFAVEQDCRIGMGTQNIGGGTGGNFEYKKNGAVLSVLFSLICSVLSSYFEGNISANLVQPLEINCTLLGELCAL